MKHWPLIRESAISFWHAILDYDRPYSDSKRLRLKIEREARRARRLARDKILADNSKALELMAPQSVSGSELGVLVRVKIDGDDEIEEDRPKHVGPATPRQRAFLDYMENRIDNKLPKEEAHQIIENSSLYAGRGRDGFRSWKFDRMVLHPDLFSSEIIEYLQVWLPDEFHEFLHTQFRGSSERISKKKIDTAIDYLTRDNATWWHGRDRNHVLLKCFKVMFPNCCDGTPPKKS